MAEEWNIVKPGAKISGKGKWELGERITMGGGGPVHSVVGEGDHRAQAHFYLPSRFSGLGDLVSCVAKAKTAYNVCPDVIIPPLESGYHEGLPYVIYDVSGIKPLLAHLEPGKACQARDVTGFLEALCMMLALLHEEKVFHLGLSPVSIFLREGGISPLNTIVLDWCLMHEKGHASFTTPALEKACLPVTAYVSPEQAAEKETPGPRADLYAVGAITFRLIVGRDPFDGPDVQTILEKVLSEEPARLLEREEGLAPEMRDFLVKALEKDPEKRYGNASEMMEAFSGAASKQDAIGKPGRPETVKADAPKPEAPPPEAPKPEPTKPEPLKPEAPKPEPPKPPGAAAPAKAPADAPELALATKASKSPPKPRAAATAASKDGAAQAKGKEPWMDAAQADGKPKDRPEEKKHEPPPMFSAPRAVKGTEAKPAPDPQKIKDLLSKMKKEDHKKEAPPHEKEPAVKGDVKKPPPPPPRDKVAAGKDEKAPPGEKKDKAEPVEAKKEGEGKKEEKKAVEKEKPEEKEKAKEEKREAAAMPVPDLEMAVKPAQQRDEASSSTGEIGAMLASFPKNKKMLLIAAGSAALIIIIIIIIAAAVSGPGKQGGSSDENLTGGQTSQADATGGSDAAGQAPVTQEDGGAAPAAEPEADAAAAGEDALAPEAEQGKDEEEEAEFALEKKPPKKKGEGTLKKPPVEEEKKPAEETKKKPPTTKKKKKTGAEGLEYID